ncbi:phage tail protein [Methylocaldum sp.]|uniref:phage tail protein n=1 Tax=Methylocaldum sp. TaxID=1969727 RepID=UPI002D62FABA|nr:tail fiber protein [Methylocaldum sp.]HYE36519.1 tail fiber protein [Methylocaldum sp.]
MDPILGQIILWPIPWVPQGWALCDGSLLSISQNTALFSLIGTTYGGNGQTTFALPDLRNRVPVGSPNMSNIGGIGGSASAIVNATGTGAVTVGINNLPAHNHSAAFSPSGNGSSINIAIPAVSGTTGTTNVPDSTMSLTQSPGGQPNAQIYSAANPNTTLKPFPVSVPASGGTVTVDNTGSGQPIPISVNVPVTIDNMQPYLVLNYIIAMQGIFPSRP